MKAFTADIHTLGSDCTTLFANTTVSMRYKYDALGNLLAAKDTNARTVSYLYNQASARTRITYPDGSFVDLGSGQTGYNTLDALNRVTGPKHSSGSTLYALTYNSLGQRTILNKGGGTAVTTYTYDGIGRLATFKDDLPSTANDITWTFAYNPAGQVSSWSSTSAVYDYKEPPRSPPSTRPMTA
ncbi:MAG: RHS repeat domain-containing protein [Asticcacaulis sp.]